MLYFDVSISPGLYFVKQYLYIKNNLHYNYKVEVKKADHN